MKVLWDNNFNAFRLIAASSVILNHAYALELPHGALPEDPLLSTEVIGWAAVNTFFVMSGYLIMSSLMRSPDVISFFRNRFLRIFPGLFVCVLISTVFLGVFVSSLPLKEYLSASETWRYVAQNSTLISIRYNLPGVFEGNPYQGTVNGSLWTLPFEAICYITAGVFAGIGAFAHKRISILVIAATIVVFATIPLLQEKGLTHSYTLERMGRFGFCFYIGMIYAQLRSRFPLRFWYVALAGILAAMLLDTPFRLQAVSAALCILVLWLAFVRNPILRALSKLPDYSYGIYIYAFAIQQILQFQLAALPTLVKAALAFVLVVPVAALSWHLIEKPALKLKTASRGIRGLGSADGPVAELKV